MSGISDRKIVYLLLCLGNITISFNVAAISAAIPAISAGLKLPDILIAKIIPYYMIPYGLGALIYAPLTKYVTYRMVMVITMSIFAVTCLVCGFIHSLGPFLLARIIMGTAAASMIPLGLMLIGELFEKETRGRLVGLFFSCSFFASLAGVTVSGIADWRYLFTIPALLGMLTAVSVLIFGSGLLNKRHTANINYVSALGNPRIRNIFLFIFAISFLYHGVHKWFGIYLSRIYHLDKLSISVFFIVSALAGLTGQILGGYLSDKKGRLVSCYTGIIGLSAGIMLLRGEYSLIMLAAVFILIAMGWTIGHNGISTVLTDFSHQDRPVMASLNSSVRFISGGLGFFVSSFFVAQSFSLTFFCIGILLLLLFFIIRKVIL